MRATQCTNFFFAHILSSLFVLFSTSLTACIVAKSVQTQKRAVIRFLAMLPKSLETQELYHVNSILHRHSLRAERSCDITINFALHCMNKSRGISRTKLPTKCRRESRKMVARSTLITPSKGGLSCWILEEVGNLSFYSYNVQSIWIRNDSCVEIRRI